MRSIIPIASDGSDSGHPPEHPRERLINDIFDRLHSLSNVTDELERGTQTLTGLNKNQVLAIKVVSRLPSVSVSTLARSMNLKPASMVRILDRLEEQGLIVRTRSNTDRRVVKINVTEKAAAIEPILRNSTHESLKHCLEATDDRDLSDILGSLRNLSFLLDAAYVDTSRGREVPR